MKKTIVILVTIIVVVLLAVVFSDFSFGKKKVDWRETYSERHTRPYGVKVFYEELSKIYDDKTLRTVYHYPNGYLYAHGEYGDGDHFAAGTYMIIGNSGYLNDGSIYSLLEFVSDGNALFLSDHYIPQELKDSLNIKVTNDDLKDSLLTLSLADKYRKTSRSNIDRVTDQSYIFQYDDETTTVLGHTEADEVKKVNFVKVAYGDGDVFIHLQPKAFTNYHLLKNEDHYKYVEGILSQLPNADIYFDSYYKYQDSTPGDSGMPDQHSNLKFLLSQPAFKWAWYLMWLLALIFIIFNGKRRQRIIQTIKPLQNTTMAFTKTIANLYYETKDHENLIRKKITYFLAKVRTDHYLDTQKLDEKFIKQLALKSNKDQEIVRRLIDYINWSRKKKLFNEGDLIQLNTLIEDFYKK